MNKNRMGQERMGYALSPFVALAAPSGGHAERDWRERVLGDRCKRR